MSATVATLAASQVNAQCTPIVMEEMMVPAVDPGIEIYVRNKRPADIAAFRPERTLLFVHGATYPAETAFDLKLDGLSWMEHIAARGYDVYLLDVRGYGKSTRPREMDDKPEANGPIVRGDTAVKDIGTVVDFVLARRNIPRVNLLGWSWGTTLMATYYDAEQRESRAPRALRAVMDSPDALAGADRPRPDACLPHGVARFRARPLDDRRPGGQEGGAHSARLVRCLGRCHLGHRP